MFEEYKRCTRCIMDTTDPEIEFDSEGICNHCRRFDKLLEKRVFEGNEAKEELNSITSRIKKSGKNKEYDCIIGVSGGVDSTYVAYLTKKLGLNPLAIHFDNGWNSELAVNNIEKTLEKLDIDLYTYVIDWPTFKDLQLSFLKASTPDGEIPTDHAINALLFREANKRGIKFIINGMNFATESMAVPSWSYGHSDWKYIKAIHKKFGSKSLKKYPKYSFLDLTYWTFIKRINVVSILNYIEYNKDEVMKILEEKLDWVYYGGKHYESVYTRFYQGYILPEKFNIDKRIGHLSDLIRSGQINRKEALHKLDEPIYDENLLKQDKAFVIKKFKLSVDEFDKLIQLPVKSYKDYPNSAKTVNKVKTFVNTLRQKGLYSK
jgi:N-acetyl sugar amidotransferase